MNLRLEYIENTNIPEEQYLEFLSKVHGKNAMHRYKDRGDWYLKTGDYHILLAILNGKIVGQASYFTIDAIAEKKDIRLSWGADTFVLEEARGKGIGKKLQKKLHEDAVNFSSACYAPINGIIKRKCGAREFKRHYFPFYPISRFATIFIELAIIKVLKKKIKFNFRIPNFYFFLNKKNIKQYTIYEINKFEDKHIKFIQDTLSSKYDFYIKRDAAYLEWKYFENPDLQNFHIIEVRKGETIEAIISFSEAKERTYISTQYIGSSILDMFIKKNSDFTEKHVISLITEYYKKQGITLDGIFTIFNIPYWPKLRYPFFGSPLLSTYNGEINRPYISFMDQDMEQM